MSIILIVGLVLLVRFPARTGLAAAQAEADAVTHTRAARIAIQEQIDLHTGLSPATQRTRTTPQSVDPSWFGPSVPTNPFFPASSGIPWMEIAPAEERGLEHPRALVADRRDQASFWYNPAIGVVRARVSGAGSEADVRARYEAVNADTIDVEVRE